MKITWLTINSSYSHSSLALPVIHAAVQEKYEWTHITATLKDDCADICCRIEETDVLCAPVYLFNRNMVLDVLSRIKVIYPNCIVIAGGPEALSEGAQALFNDCPAIDYICQGEGEVSMPGFFRALAAGKSPEISGILSRQQSCTECAPVFMEWSNAMLPCQDSFYDSSKPFVQVETSRGCPNSCIFCTSARTKVRYKAIDDVRAELEALYERNIREIRILDRTFNLPDSRAAALVRLFRENFPQNHFHMEIHPAFIGEQLRKELALAPIGTLHLEAGIQSLAPDVMNAIGRGDAPSQVLEGLSFLCSLENIEVHTDLLAGCPCQTYASLRSNLADIIKIGPAEIQLEVLKVLHGTALHDNAPALGIAYSPLPPYDVIKTPTMSIHDMRRARLLSRMTDLFYNCKALRKAFAQLAKEDFLESFLDYIVAKGFSTGPAPQLKQRFLWLYEFAGTSDELACSWLNEAFPIGQGPATKSCFVSSMPENAVHIYGYDTIPQNSHIVRLELQQGAAFFLYNRGIAPNKAIGLFKTNS